MRRGPYIDKQTGLNNVDAILEDYRSGRLSYADEYDDEDEE